MFNTPEGRRILKYSAVVIVLLGVFLIAQAIHTFRSTAYLGRSMPATNVITVNGTGEIFAKADIATFSFGVMVESKSVAEAQRIATERMNKAIDLVKKAGIDEADIKTIGYNINPHYESSRVVCTPYSCPPVDQEITGYEVSQTVQVKVRDIEKAGDILGQLGSAEVTNISGLSFTIDDEDKVQSQARDLAIADAQSKAKDLAKQLHVRLGSVVNFNEGYIQPYYRMEAAYGLGGADDAKNSVAPQLPVGENQILSNVSITYEIR